VGELHHETEVRIETILPEYKKGEVIRALLSKHPYEEPAYDLYPLHKSDQELSVNWKNRNPNSNF
jgi:hypothetical protein